MADYIEKYVTRVTVKNCLLINAVFDNVEVLCVTLNIRFVPRRKHVTISIR
jgi:hypothetical protein